MTLLDYAEGRIESFVVEIEKLLESEFPYVHSKQALEDILRRYKEEQSDLKRLRTKPSDTVRARCKVSLGNLMRDLPFLGFILRSTNIRNAFEVYGPLLEMARRLLGPRAKLILSSEWTYSPHTYPLKGITILPEFVLIGTPAPESANPLLIPLAGHELGHSIWRQRGDVEKILRAKINAFILDSIRAEPDLFTKHFDVQDMATVDSEVVSVRTWGEAASLAVNQAEESFCDLVGLRIFGAAYAQSFAYLMSPGYSGDRHVKYPSLVRRASDLRKAAEAYQLEIVADYEGQFQNLAEPKIPPQRQFLLQLADKASAASVDTLIPLVQEIVKDVSDACGPSDQGELAKCLQEFRPVEGSGGISNIINAGWRAYSTISDSPSKQEIPKTDQLRALREVVLKSIEVYEIETIMASPGTA